MIMKFIIVFIRAVILALLLFGGGWLLLCWSELAWVSFPFMNLLEPDAKAERFISLFVFGMLYLSQWFSWDADDERYINK